MSDGKKCLHCEIRRITEERIVEGYDRGQAFGNQLQALADYVACFPVAVQRETMIELVLTKFGPWVARAIEEKADRPFPATGRAGHA